MRSSGLSINKTNSTVLELVVLILVAGLVFVVFGQGVEQKSVSLVSSSITLAFLIPMILSAKDKGISIINAKSMVLFGVLYWVLLDGILTREGIEQFSPGTIVKVFSMITLFIVTFIFSYMIPWPTFFLKLIRKLNYKHAFAWDQFYSFILACFFLGFLPMLLWGGGIDRIVWELTHAGRWTAQWGRGRWGGWRDYFITGMSYFQMLAIQLAGFYSIIRKTSVLLSALMFLSLLFLFDSGARSALAPAVIPLFLIYYLKPHQNKIKSWAIIIIGAVVLLAVMQLQFLLRDAPSYQSTREISQQYISSIFKKNPTEHHRDDQFYRLALYSEHVPDKIPFSGENLILRPLYHYIPRAIWADKPEGVMRFLEEETNAPGEGLTTYAMSIFGEFYICQGWMGIIIIGLFMGFLARQFDSLIEMSRKSPAVLLMYCYGLGFLFVSVRSYQVIYEGWYIFIFMYWVLRISRARVSKS
jgi:oligosaccharide repeat unit polymerase